MPESGHVAWRNQVPWWVDDAIEALGQRLTASMVVFEWGTGASTIWLARRVERVVSVDNDKEWSNKVSNVLVRDGIENVELHLAHGDDYPQAIHDHGIVDVVVVDGRKRVACYKEARDHISPGGILIADDTHRVRYRPGLELYDGWKRQDYQVEKRITSILICPT